MKAILLFLAFIIEACNISAQVKMPAPSPTQFIKQDFANGTIEVTYSRPAARGRKIFGDLVPFNKLWRTGANAATIISFSEPVDILGKHLDSGHYALYTIPGTENWQIILNKGIKNWGVEGYTDSADVLRVQVPAGKIKPMQENFTIQVANVKPESCEIQLYWEKTMVSVPVTVNIKDKLKEQIEAALQKGTKPYPYWQAAQYYYEYDKNLQKALHFADLAATDNPGAYWIWLYKAKIQRDMKDKSGAIVSANKSLELATKADNADYVKMNKDLLKKLRN